MFGQSYMTCSVYALTIVAKMVKNYMRRSNKTVYFQCKAYVVFHCSPDPGYLLHTQKKIERISKSCRQSRIQVHGHTLVADPGSFEQMLSIISRCHLFRLFSHKKPHLICSSMHSNENPQPIKSTRAYHDDIK
jgi:hypothetical protein